MKDTRRKTWTGFLKEVSDQHVVADRDLSDKVGEIFSLNEDFINAFNHCAPMIYLLDYTSGNYITVSKTVKTIMGFHPEDFIDGGLGFTIERYHKDHLRLFDKEIFPDRLDFLKGIPKDDQAKYIFSYSLSLKARDGQYRTLLQRNIHVKSDDKGNPLMSLGIAINTTSFKSPESPVKQTIEKVTNGEMPKLLFERQYAVKAEHRIFSKRETEVLLWMAEGMASKQIAGKMNLSEATISVHRKNMLRKAGVNNVAALIAFAFRKNII